MVGALLLAVGVIFGVSLGVRLVKRICERHCEVGRATTDNRLHIMHSFYVQVLWLREETQRFVVQDLS